MYFCQRKSENFGNLWEMKTYCVHYLEPLFFKSKKKPANNGGSLYLQICKMSLIPPPATFSIERQKNKKPQTTRLKSSIITFYRSTLKRHTRRNYRPQRHVVPKPDFRVDLNTAQFFKSLNHLKSGHIIN